MAYIKPGDSDQGIIQVATTDVPPTSMPSKISESFVAVADHRSAVRPHIRAAFEASWAQSEDAYRYLAR